VREPWRRAAVRQAAGAMKTGVFGWERDKPGARYPAFRPAIWPIASPLAIGCKKIRPP
jgi:hypothetical protein